MGKLKSGLGWSFQRDVFPAEELVFGSFHMFHLKSVCSTGENKSIPPYPHHLSKMVRVGRYGLTLLPSELHTCLCKKKTERESTTPLAVKGYRAKKKHRVNVRKMFLASTGTAVN